MMITLTMHGVADQRDDALEKTLDSLMEVLLLMGQDPDIQAQLSNGHVEVSISFSTSDFEYAFKSGKRIIFDALAKIGIAVEEAPDQAAPIDLHGPNVTVEGYNTQRQELVGT